jgi:hypothetical protein
VVSHSSLQTLKRFLPAKVRKFFRLLRQRNTRLWPPRLRFDEAPAQPRPSPFSAVVAPDNPLSLLGEKYQPTKRLHHYLPHYWAHFRDIRHDVRRVLEIGVQSDRSLRMWEEFFPKAIIDGVDIDAACKQYEGDRRRLFIGDQGDRKFLRSVAESLDIPYDIIIDDGSHLVAHQVHTFECLFPLLSEHGVYVLEDTGAVAGDWNLSVAHALARLIDSVLYAPPGMEPGDVPSIAEFPAPATWADKHVVGIAFYRWIVFVMRGHNPGDNPFLQANKKASSGD